MQRLTAAVVALLVLAVCSAVFAGAPADVPRDHWAYNAVNELANKGYVFGYPDGSFLGDRTLTRYEFACIINRVVDGIEKSIQNDTNTQTAPKAAAKMPKNDLASVKKLADEFKVELAVMGTRLDALEAAVEGLEVQMADVKATVDATDSKMSKVAKDVEGLKKVKAGGYVIARYTSFDGGESSATEPDDTFDVRAARVKFTANPTEKSTAVLQLGMDRNDTKVVDAYLSHLMGGSWSAAIGQMRYPFGVEAPMSLASLKVPEKALAFRRLITSTRDRGLNLTTKSGNGFAFQVGVWDGSGIKSGENADNNGDKDVVVNVRPNLGDLKLGFSGYFGKGVWDQGRKNAIDVDKVRFGVDAAYAWDNFGIEAEYIRGKGVDEAQLGFDQSEWIDGYYAQLYYDVTAKGRLVARYASLSEDPVPATDFGRRSSWDFGYTHTLDAASSISLFYKINEEERNEIDNDGFIGQWLTKY